MADSIYLVADTIAAISLAFSVLGWIYLMRARRKLAKLLQAIAVSEGPDA